MRATDVARARTSEPGQDGSPATTAACPSAAEFGLRFLGEVDGRLCERRSSLAVGWNTRFERVRPVREFPSYQGQRSFSGFWWSSTMQDLVGFESWLERDQVMMLDFSRKVKAFASQPFWLSWPAGTKVREHAPDYFARLLDGTGLVIDVRADDDIKPQDAEAFAATEAACETVGWIYRRVGAIDPVLAANVRWLSDYKHPHYLRPDHTSALKMAFAQPAPLLATVRSVGDPIGVLPSLFHLMWRGVLHADLAGGPLTGTTLVTAVGRAR
jgi:hypothetical protein